MTELPLETVFQRAIDGVTSAKVSYLVYGGLALPVWGDVIQTRDVDLVVSIEESQAPAFVAALRGEGFAVPANAESMLFIDKWIIARLGGIDLDVALGATPFDAEALRRAVRVRLFGREVPVASAEDLILYKLAAFRFKDLGHVEDILDRQGAKLDLPYLRRWARKIAEVTGKFEIPSTVDKLLADRGL